MIIKNTYFKGNIYIPHAKPSITDGIEEVEGSVLEFINDYSRDCLFKSLGSVLFHEFKDNLDSNKPNGLKDTADVKWDNLLNGNEYIDQAGEDVVWRGIRYKSIDNGEYDRSFLANYVYYKYERFDYITRSDIGNQIEDAKNATVIAPTQKVVEAWNRFVKLVQGTDALPQSYTDNYNNLIGIDWFGSDNEDVSMYKFINDANAEIEDTYAKFKPKTWNVMNQYGI